ncbi:unnamed protein product [Porites lobata]|uniref:Uncharacterized protein n=1 Tax=Porites lobata TaxID=104759 RepID=A0ABN8SE90_9CNID|nr:unnamed protein product [Porites lobata]
MKEKIRKEYNRRVRLILRTELNGRNKIEAINSLAVPVVQYSIGIIDWKISELKTIDTKTRKLLNMHKMLHPRADVERLYIPRKDGGRGLIDVETVGRSREGVGHEVLSLVQETAFRLFKMCLCIKDRFFLESFPKFKREVTMPEIENRVDKSASENAKALKHVFKSKMKSMKE